MPVSGKHRGPFGLSRLSRCIRRHRDRAGLRPAAPQASDWKLPESSATGYPAKHVEGTPSVPNDHTATRMRLCHADGEIVAGPLYAAVPSGGREPRSLWTGSAARSVRTHGFQWFLSDDSRTRAKPEHRSGRRANGADAGDRTSLASSRREVRPLKPRKALAAIAAIAGPREPLSLRVPIDGARRLRSGGDAT